jgi:predicted nucleotidyltransferase
MMERLLLAAEGLVDACERVGVRYALGGAMANTYWGIVRTTQDVDCLVEVPALRYQALVDELTRFGFTLQNENGEEEALSVAAIRAQGQQNKFFDVYFGGLRVQVFVPCVALQSEILRRAVDMPLGSRLVKMTTAEDLVLLKMSFHRQKDLLDVRGILRVQSKKLDLDYVRRWSAQMLTDEVQQELEQMIKESGE